MATSVSVTGNAIVATVAFEDANGESKNPDPGTKVSWKVLAENKVTERFSVDQEIEDRIATGTYVFAFTPLIEERLSIQATAIIDGRAQVARIFHDVEWVLS